MRALIPALPRSAWTVLAADTFSAVGTGLTLPFLIVYLHTVHGFALGPVGLVAATVALAGLAGNPLGGWLADRAGPRTALITGLVIAAAGALALSGVSHLWQAFAAAAVSGLGVATAWPAQDALLASLVRPAARSGAFTLRHATLNVGLGSGGLLAALIVDTADPSSFTTLYLLDAASFVLAIPLLLGRSVAGPADAESGSGRPTHKGSDALPQPTHEGSDALPQPTHQGSDALPQPTYGGHDAPSTHRDGYAKVLGDARFRRLWLLLALLIAVGYGQFNEVFPAHLVQPGGPGARIVAVMGIANTITVVLAQLLTARLLTGHRRTRGLMLLCGLWALSWILVWLDGLGAGLVGAGMAVVVAVVFGIGETLLAPTAPAITNDIAPEALRGRYNGGMTLAYTTGFLAGPAVGGFALAGLGSSWFAVVAVLCGAGVLLALRLERGLPLAANGLPAPEELSRTAARTAVPAGRTGSSP
ncbi:MFS transporter [Streptomyces sp. NPDC059008]|uniref:MFS transporter n=1 Tax=Streptomyces sp. NPDC059008 TaxID=3346693 RepID=UPI0036C238FE